MEIKKNSKIDTLKSKFNLYRSLKIELANLNGKKLSLYNYYPLNKPLNIEDIQIFEEKHNCTLPNDYKLFLLNIGDGGFGPCGGPILTLKESTIIPYDDDFKLPISYYQNEFIFSKEAMQLSEFPLEKLISKDISDRSQFIEENYYLFFQGVIFIGDHLDGWVDMLVISGPERGNIWEFGNFAFYPKKSQSGKNRVNFLDWYNEWVEDKVNSLRNEVENVRKDKELGYI